MEGIRFLVLLRNVVNGITMMVNAKPINEKQAPPSVSDATILWHFTKPTALRSILANGLFGKDATKLDDKNECALHRLWLSPLTDCVRLAVSSDKFPEATEKTGKNGILQGRFIVPFITCFSESPVYEYMWNEYTHEGGYAIGFDKKTIERYTAGKKAYLETCHYLNFDEQLQNAERAIPTIKKICVIVRNGNRCSQKTKNWLAECLIRSLQHRLRPHKRKYDN